MTLDPILKRQLIRFECRDQLHPDLKAYRDTRGFWTVAIGHLVGPGDTPRIAEVTNDEALALYAWDVALAEQRVRSVIVLFDHLIAPRQRALINMSFNRGNNFVTSSTITPAVIAASASDSPAAWMSVQDAIAGSEWAGQVKGRAVWLGQVLATGVET